MSHRMHPYGDSHARSQANQAYANMSENPGEPEEKPEEAESPESVSGAEAGDQTETREVADKVDPSEEARREIEDARLRMAAEMDNFKKRLNREHQEHIRYANEKVLSDLLPALDNLDLAIQHAPKDEACQNMMQGIEMTRKQLLDAIAKHGLTAVGEEGEPFNPEIHEAIGIEPREDLEKGAVSRVLQKGYKLNDRLARPAKVLVNN